MANDGVMHSDPMHRYEDLVSLKKHINSGARVWDLNNVNEIHRHIVQLSTGTAAELENTDAIAISQITRTAKTIIMASDTDDNAYDDQTVTMVYITNANVSTTAVATFNTTSTTEVAFVPAVADFYAMVSLTCSVTVEAGDNICVGVTGAVAGIADPAVCFGVIRAAATTAVQADLHGVGNAYVRSHTNHNDADGAILYMEYLSGIGTIKNAMGTIPAADGTVETRMFEATVAAGVYTTTTNTLKDFYRVRALWTDTTPTANSHEYFVCDSNLGNVDGSGGDAWAVILEGSVEWSTFRYTPPIGYDAWVASIHANATQTAAGDSYRVDHYYKTDQGQITHVEPHYFDQFVEWQEPELLEEMVDTYFTILDTAGAAICTLGTIIVEAKRHS